MASGLVLTRVTITIFVVLHLLILAWHPNPRSRSSSRLLLGWFSIFEREQVEELATDNKNNIELVPAATETGFGEKIKVKFTVN